MDEHRELYPTLVADARTMLANGRNIDDVLVSLRSRCPSIIQSIKVVHEVTGISLGEAKMLVHHSAAWRDLAGDFSTLHETAEAAYGREGPTPSDGSHHTDDDQGEDNEV